MTESYLLEMVPASKLDDKCYWFIGGSGNQERKFINNNNTKPLCLHIGQGTYSFSEDEVSLRYGNHKNGKYFSIGIKAGYWLKYDEATNSFSTIKGEGGATIFEYANYDMSEGESGSFSEEIEVSVEHMGSTTVQALQEMLRNEIIHLHLVFE